jgi:hypothetical protein
MGFGSLRGHPSTDGPETVGQRRSGSNKPDRTGFNVDRGGDQAHSAISGNRPRKGSVMPSDDYARIFNIVGLLVGLGGILILFRWGMPFRVESHGHIILASDQKDPRGIALDHIYVICGWVGLLLLITGVILQIIAQLLPPTPLPPPVPGTNP